MPVIEKTGEYAILVVNGEKEPNLEWVSVEPDLQSACDEARDQATKSTIQGESFLVVSVTKSFTNQP